MNTTATTTISTTTTTSKLHIANRPRSWLTRLLLLLPHFHVVVVVISIVGEENNEIETNFEQKANLLLGFCSTYVYLFLKCCSCCFCCVGWLTSYIRCSR